MFPPHLQEGAGGRWQILSLGLEDDQGEGEVPLVGSLPPSSEVLHLAMDHLSFSTHAACPGNTTPSGPLETTQGSDRQRQETS